MEFCWNGAPVKAGQVLNFSASAAADLAARGAVEVLAEKPDKPAPAPAAPAPAEKQAGSPRDKQAQTPADK